MEFFFADDSSQKGAREGMSKLVAFGGFFLNEDALKPLSKEIDDIASKYGVPKGDEIKWSPRKDSWIYNNLKGNDRKNCYSDILNVVVKYDAKVIVVVCDPVMDGLKMEWGFERCVQYALERISMHLDNRNVKAVVVADRPGGGYKEDNKFLADFLEHLEDDANYVLPESVALNVLTTPSHLNRHLQVADLITAITTCMVAGQVKYAEPLFEIIKPMFITNLLGYKGGTGLKVYPNKLINLYRWVLGESHFSKARYMAAIPLPYDKYLYSENDGR